MILTAFCVRRSSCSRMRRLFRRGPDQCPCFFPGLCQKAAAPGFTLKEPAGPERTVQPGDGKVYVINFWATWCPPCRSEMPELNTFAQKHKEKVQFYGVNLQEEGDKVQGFLKDNGYTMPVLLDQEGKAATLYKVRVIPTTVILDEKGNILQRQ